MFDKVLIALHELCKLAKRTNQITFGHAIFVDVVTLLVIMLYNFSASVNAIG